MSRVVTFGDSAAYWAPEPLPVCDSCGPDMVLIVTGSEPAKNRLHPHTRARHGSWRACASDALQAARVASEAGTTCSRAPHSSNACARNLRRGLRLRHCSLRSSATQVHQQGIQCERTLCVRRRHVAEHGRTPAVAARMPPAVLLVINLRIGTAAGCSCSCSSSLLPAAQRGVQKSRGFVAPEAERIQAHRPELDGSTRLTETHATGHGWTAEREVESGASDKTTRKPRI